MEMKAAADILIINASELLTMRSRNAFKIGDELNDPGIIKNGSIAIRGGLIIDTGETERLKITTPADKNTKIINAANKVVMPGFVDCHTHLIFAGSRENEFILKAQGRHYLDILKAGGGIISTVRKTRLASEDELFELAMKRLDSMLSFGTTSVEVKTGYGLDFATEIKILKVAAELQKKHPIDVIATFLGAHAIPPEYKDRADDYAASVIGKMLPEAAKMSRYCDVFCEKGAFNLQQSRQVLEAAKRWINKY